MYYWTASNNSNFLNGCRQAKTLLGAVRAGRSYVMGELYGEGTLTIWRGRPHESEPVRVDYRGIFSGFSWESSTF